MNKLVIVSGHSGSGKTSIMRSIMDNELISFTTRRPRKDEVEGIDYHFISKDVYDHLLKENKLAEHTEYGGNHYGLTLEEVQSKTQKGTAFVIADCNGMNQLKAIYPNSISIFLYTPREQALKQMQQRGDTFESISKRISTYENEMKNKVHYDYFIRNNDGQINKTADIIRSIIESEVNA